MTNQLTPTDIFLFGLAAAGLVVLFLYDITYRALIGHLRDDSMTPHEAINYYLKRAKTGADTRQPDPRKTRFYYLCRWHIIYEHHILDFFKHLPLRGTIPTSCHTRYDYQKKQRQKRGTDARYYWPSVIYKQGALRSVIFQP